MNIRNNIRWPALAAALASAAALTAGAILVNPTGAGPPPSGQAVSSIETGESTSDGGLAAVAGPSYKGPFGFGRDATPEEIAAWDIDVSPDGRGLPPGSGTVEQGAAIFAQKCSPCHGSTGTEGPFDVLVKPFDPSASWPQYPRTIGNYWPYATTVYDYVNRAMPFISPNSLEDDEVYSLTAFLLSRNGLIPEDAVMNAETLPAVEMPARRFFRQEIRPPYRPE